MIQAMLRSLWGACPDDMDVAVKAMLDDLYTGLYAYRETWYEGMEPPRTEQLIPGLHSRWSAAP